MVATDGCPTPGVAPFPTVCAPIPAPVPAVASDDVAKDLLGTRAWGIEYDVGPLTRKAEKAGNFSPGSQADHRSKGGPLVAQGIMPVLLSVFVAVSAYESVVSVRVNDRVGGGVRRWYRGCRVAAWALHSCEYLCRSRRCPARRRRCRPCWGCRICSRVIKIGSPSFLASSWV